MTPPRRVIVVGGGITGLTVAYRTAERGVPVMVFERGPRPGGLARTEQREGFRLDYGPHKIYTTIPGVLDEVRRLVGSGRLREVPKRSRIRLNGRFLNFPLGLKDMILGISPWMAARGLAGYAAAQAMRLWSKASPESYEDWLVERFGRPLYNLVFQPIAAKIWGEPKQLAWQLAARRVAVPSLLELVRQTLLGRGGRPVISADTFFYPEGGVGGICDAMVERLRKSGGEVRTGHSLARVEVSDGLVRALSFEGRPVEPVGEGEVVVSTLHVQMLVSCLAPPAPPDILVAAGALRMRHLVLVYLVVQRPRMSADCWLFFPEARYVFNRVSEQKAFDPGMGPPDKTVVTAEITCAPEDALWTEPDDRLIDLVAGQIVEAGLCRREEVERGFVVRVPSVYQVYDRGYAERLQSALGHLDQIKNLYTIGRQGLFNYVGTMDCMDMGMVTTEFLFSGRPRSDWPEQRKRFEEYQVID